jgi:aminoglycoside phosphotransferase (APT) family kinase protein
VDEAIGIATHRVTVLQSGSSRTVRRQWMSAKALELLGGDLAVELRAQQKAALIGLAPRVQRVDTDARWIEMEWVQGHHLPADWLQEAAYVRQFIGVLQRLQQIPCSDLPTLCLLERCAVLHSRLSAVDAVRARGHESALRALHERLGAGSPPSEGESFLVHGDLHADNVIVRASESRATDVGALSEQWCLLDWEYAHRGHALEDLAGVLVGQPGVFQELARGRGALAFALRESGWSLSLSSLETACEVRQVLNALWLDLFAALQKEPLTLE